MGILESCIREDLDANAPRAMAVLHPLKVVLTNYPDDKVEMLNAPNHPKDEAMGSRELPFCNEIYIDREDFMEVKPNKHFKRLVSGEEVRLRNAYVIRCDEVIKDPAGEIIELRCSVDMDTLGKNPEGRKVKGVIHWVSARHGLHAEVRLYDRLFNVPHPDAEKGVDDFTTLLNPDSLRTLTQCVLESSLASAQSGSRYQFEREGYFCFDGVASTAERPVFNRVVQLRDSWAKIEQGQ